jgi:type II secretory pathway component PulJ
MNRRVKAFTIMEITVAMLISALVIGLAYTCFTIIYQQYHIYNSKQTELMEVDQLNKVLQSDFDKAEMIMQDNDDIVIKNKNGQLSYRIMPAYVLRIANATDTFKVSMQDVTRYFEGKPLTNQSDLPEGNRMDELSFTIIYHNEKIPYYYIKQYSSQNLINRNTHAIN